MKTLNSPQYMINANEDPLLSIEQENVYMFIFYPLIVWGCYCTILDIPEKWTYFLTAILLRSCLFHTKVLRISKSNIIQSEHLEYPKKTTSPSRYHRRAGVPSADGRICGSMCWGQTSPGPNNPFATAWQYQRPGATSVELLEVKEHGPYCEIFGRFFKSEVYLNFGYKLTWKNGGNWIVGDVHHLGVEIFQTQIKYGGSWDSVHRFTLMHPPTGSMLSLHILMSHSVHHHGIPPNHRLSWIEYLHGKDLMCEFGAVIF